LEINKCCKIDEVRLSSLIHDFAVGWVITCGVCKKIMYSRVFDKSHQFSRSILHLTELQHDLIKNWNTANPKKDEETLDKVENNT